MEQKFPSLDWHNFFNAHELYSIFDNNTWQTEFFLFIFFKF